MTAQAGIVGIKIAAEALVTLRAEFRLSLSDEAIGDVRAKTPGEPFPSIRVYVPLTPKGGACGSNAPGPGECEGVCMGSLSVKKVKRIAFGLGSPWSSLACWLR
jgi:hypothetical protein